MTAADPGPDPDRPTVAPFMAALVIIVLVVIGIGLVNLLGGGDEPTPQELVARAAVAQNDALQREAYADYRAHTCAEQQGTEADVLARQRDSKGQKGPRYVDDITDISVSGDRATATVTYSFESARDDKTEVETPFARQDGAWKVCSTGPS